ncbi:DUF4265 domain-containing protein [Rhizobacter sp. OV335]|uniref:DUF4265 domain-containing protein n=1 Tax=Rhizobacter sp. OV335 TaxID=1500264 RepID=UPI00091DFE07|nr:DUF4265 domain-containing protein [Rhizobacter sp. OV335]SHN10805.1 protein of unknown function [Rhizobacter sp. OV335]
MVDRPLKTINVHVGSSNTGEPVFEEMLVTDLGDSVMRVERSPGLVLGIARGDEIRYRMESGQFEVLRRAGNVAIQVYYMQKQLSEQQISAFAESLGEAMGATWDGFTPKQAVFSIDLKRNGFPAIENAFNRFIEGHPRVEWHYSNVFADDGTTPLNWW